MKNNYGSISIVFKGEMNSTQETPWFTEASLENMFGVLSWRCTGWELTCVVEKGDLTLQPTMADTLS